MQLDDFLAQRQAEAGAALTASRGEEGLEDAARVGRRNAWTIVRQA